MRDVTEKNRIISELVSDEISRLEKLLESDTISLRSEEQGLLNLNRQVEKSENLIKDYKLNINHVKNRIETLDENKQIRKAKEGNKQ